VQFKILIRYVPLFEARHHRSNCMNTRHVIKMLKNMQYKQIPMQNTRKRQNFGARCHVIKCLRTCNTNKSQCKILGNARISVPWRSVAARYTTVYVYFSCSLKRRGEWIKCLLFDETKSSIPGSTLKYNNNRSFKLQKLNLGPKKRSTLLLRVTKMADGFR
jgi:hypothetical protein